MKTVILSIIFGFAITVSAFPTHAISFNTYTDLTAFQLAAPSLSLEDFSGETSMPYFNHDVGDFSISLDNSAMPPSGYYGGNFSIFNEQLFLQGCCWWTIAQMSFDSNISALGFNWSNGDNTDRMELLVDNQSFVFGQPASQGFFGVVATDGDFSVAGFSDTTGGGGHLSWGLIDNIRYGSRAAFEVPSPGTAWLFGLVFIIFAGVSRLKRRTF